MYVALAMCYALGLAGSGCGDDGSTVLKARVGMSGLIMVPYVWIRGLWP